MCVYVCYFVRMYHASWTWLDRPLSLTLLQMWLPASKQYGRIARPMFYASRTSSTLPSMLAHTAATETLRWTSDSRHHQLSALDWNHTCVNCSCCCSPSPSSRYDQLLPLALHLTPLWCLLFHPCITKSLYTYCPQKPTRKSDVLAEIEICTLISFYPLCSRKRGISGTWLCET
jgi:hypothetical protein